MLNTHQLSEKPDLLITPNLNPNQLPKLLEEALSVAPEGEMRDMLLLSLLTNIAYALPAMRMLHGRPHHTYSADLLTMIVAPAASGKAWLTSKRNPVRIIPIRFIITGIRLSVETNICHISWL